MGAKDDAPVAPVVALCAASVLVAILALFANATQTTYYLATRDTKNRLEAALGIGDLAIATTPEMGSTRKRFGKVKTFQTVMLVVIAVAACVTGVATVANEPAAKPPSYRVALRATTGRQAPHRAQPMVVSQMKDGKTRVVKATSVAPAVPVLLDLPVGAYTASILRNEVCERPFSVTSRPLQQIRLRCP